MPFGRSPLSDLTNRSSETRPGRHPESTGQENLDPRDPREEENPSLTEEEIPLEHPRNWENMSELSSDSSTWAGREDSPMSDLSDRTWNPPRSIWPRDRREPLSSWFPRIMGNHWFERERRSAEALLRDFLRSGAFLRTNHLATNREVHFDGLSRSGAERTPIFPGMSVQRHFERRGITINPRVPLVQESGGFSPNRGDIHMDYFPTEVVDLCYFGEEENILRAMGVPTNGSPSRGGQSPPQREMSPRENSRTIFEPRRGQEGGPSSSFVQERGRGNHRQERPTNTISAHSPSRIPTIFVIFLMMIFHQNVIAKHYISECSTFPQFAAKHPLIEMQVHSMNHQKHWEALNKPLPREWEGGNQSVLKALTGGKEDQLKLIEMSSSSSSPFAPSMEDGEISESPSENEIPLCQRGVKNADTELEDATKPVGKRVKRRGKDLEALGLIDAEAREVPERKPPHCSVCGLSGHRKGTKICPFYSGGGNKIRSSTPIQELEAERIGRPTNRRALAARKPSPKVAKRATKESSLYSGLPRPDTSGLVRLSKDGQAGTSGFRENPVVPLREEIRGLQSAIDALTEEVCALRRAIPPVLTGGNATPLGRRRGRQQRSSSSEEEPKKPCRRHFYR
ncbi:hypothetical protein niasHS_004589 [Heterodera schachtii]|uniref:Zinc knuckle domain-containing protein n=1 Tax=Heterodera schachtii TaxID=97005 RepID=A0ABD2JQW8_HETSC